MPLALVGSRQAPDPTALAAALEAQAQFAELRGAIECALFEHYEPYAQALAAGELPQHDAAVPIIASPADVWPHVVLEFVHIALPGGSLTTEYGYSTAWDVEHTLGVRFEAGKLVELCGSTLPP